VSTTVNADIAEGAALAKPGALFHTTPASRASVRGSWAHEGLGGGTFIAVGSAIAVNGEKYGHDHDVTVVPCVVLETPAETEAAFVHGHAQKVRFVDVRALIAGPDPDDAGVATDGVDAHTRTAAEIVALAKRVSREAIARGCFVGQPMSANGLCGDGADAGSWLGWELRVWRDGRWNVVPAGQDRHRDLVLFVVLDRANTASEAALVRELLVSAITVEGPDVAPIGVYVARLADRSWNTTHPQTCVDRLLDVLLATTEGDEDLVIDPDDDTSEPLAEPEPDDQYDPVYDPRHAEGA
jgi:hypothetical protein